MCLTRFILSAITSPFLTGRIQTNDNFYKFNCVSYTVQVSLTNSNVRKTNVQDILTFIFIGQFHSSDSCPKTINNGSTKSQNGKK